MWTRISLFSLSRLPKKSTSKTTWVLSCITRFLRTLWLATSAGNYLSLVNTYVQPMLIHFAMVEYLPFAAYTIANKGVYKHSSENSRQCRQGGSRFSQLPKSRRLLTTTLRRFIDYMSFHASTKFPEYYTNNNDDVYPDKDSYFSQLGIVKGYLQTER
jgi:hypothetical protein